MNEAEAVRDQGSSNVSVPLLVGSVTAGAGGLWLALATPLLGISVELVFREPNQSYDPLPLTTLLSGFIPLVLISVGLSLCTRSLVQPPAGLAISRTGTLLGILAGIAVLVGCGAAIVGCLEITEAFKALSQLGGAIDPKAQQEILLQNLRNATEILTVDTPGPFLVVPAMLAIAALLGFSGGSDTSTRHGKRLVIVSIIMTVLVVAVFSLQLRDTFAFESLLNTENTEPSKLADLFDGSVNKALVGYATFAVHGVLLIVATLLGPKSR